MLVPPTTTRIPGLIRVLRTGTERRTQLLTLLMTRPCTVTTARSRRPLFPNPFLILDSRNTRVLLLNSDHPLAVWHTDLIYAAAGRYSSCHYLSCFRIVEIYPTLSSKQIWHSGHSSYERPALMMPVPGSRGCHSDSEVSVRGYRRPSTVT